MLRHPVLKKFSFALMIAVFYFYVCCPFMAVYESSEIFSKTVVKNLTGKLYFFNISPDHDELKLLLHFPAGKSRHAVYLFVKPRFPKKLYARMYPVRALDDEINSISPDDTIVLPYENDDTKHFDRLNAAVAPKGLKAVIRYTGRLGHREFASVRLIPEKNGK